MDCLNQYIFNTDKIFYLSKWLAFNQDNVIIILIGFIHHFVCDKHVSRGSFEVQHGVRSYYLHSGVLNYQGFHYGRPLLLEMRQNNVQHQAVLSNQIHKYYSKGVNNSGTVCSCVITK